MAKPIYDQRLVGRLEIFNSLYLLITGYFLLTFTNYEPSIEKKYEYGDYYFGLSLGVIGLNILIAVIVGAYQIYRNIRRQVIRYFYLKE